MNLLNLAARVCNEFSRSGLNEARTVLKIKDGQVRDVVTELDEKLHLITANFIKERLPECKLLSEESELTSAEALNLLAGECLIVDPLDGSNNYALGMSNYGYMAAHLRGGFLAGAVIVLPEDNQYIVFESGQSLFSQPLPESKQLRNAPVYYAYPPKFNISERRTRSALIDLIDEKSAGLYRYGSACVGLYRLIRGEHMAFLGHSVRLWDVIAYLPLLVSQGFDVLYCSKGLSFTLLASKRSDFLEDAAKILLEFQGMTLHKYSLNDSLRFDSL